MDHYKGVADWRIVGLLKESLDIPVIGNGDCWYAVDALRLERETGCDGVMIGRPALRNPWIFRQIDDLRNGRSEFVPTPLDVVELLERALEQFVQMFPDNTLKALGRFKELIRYVGRAWIGGRDFVKKVLRYSDAEAMIRYVRQTILATAVAEWDLDTSGRLDLERRPSGRKEPAN